MNQSIKTKLATHVIIVGSSGHCKVIIEMIERTSEYKIIGLIDSFREVGEKTLGYNILGKIQDLPLICERYNCTNLFIAIGDNWSRSVVKTKIENLLPQANFISVIDPSVIISSYSHVGQGVCIMPGSVINVNTRIEDFCIINTHASIDHDCHLLPFSSIGPSVSLAGNVTLGKCASIGIGAVTSNKVRIGDYTVVGAGAVVLNSFEDRLLVYGVPAKKIRRRSLDESYLN